MARPDNIRIHLILVFVLAPRDKQLHKVHTLPLDKARLVLGVVVYDAALMLPESYLSPFRPFIGQFGDSGFREIDVSVLEVLADRMSFFAHGIDPEYATRPQFSSVSSRHPGV